MWGVKKDQNQKVTLIGKLRSGGFCVADGPFQAQLLLLACMFKYFSRSQVQWVILKTLIISFMCFCLLFLESYHKEERDDKLGRKKTKKGSKIDISGLLVEN